MHVLIIQDEYDLRLYWKKAQGSRTIHFNYTPFSVKESRVLDCQFGPHYFKQKPTKGKRLWLQNTRKIGCQAHINVKEFVLYPEFAVSEGERETLNNWKLRCLQEEKLEILRKKVAAKQPVKISMKYFVSLPMESAHSGHPTGLSAIFTQKLHPLVSQ